MMFSAEPARNHSICSGLNVCVVSKSIVVPSGLVMRHRTGWSGVRSARPRTEMRSSSSIWSYVAGSANVSGRTPCFYQFVSWMRANDRAKITTPFR